MTNKLIKSCIIKNIIFFKKISIVALTVSNCEFIHITECYSVINIYI